MLFAILFYFVFYLLLFLLATSQNWSLWVRCTVGEGPEWHVVAGVFIFLFFIPSQLFN